MSAIAIGVGVSAAAAVASVALTATKKPPKAAQFQPVNFQQEQRTAITGNLGAFGEASNLARQTNTFNAEEINRMLELSLPGAAGMKHKATANITDWMSGKLSIEDTDAIRTSAAGRAVGGGFGGTGMGRNLEARDLGLSQLDIKMRGTDAASRWLAAARSPVFDVSSLFVKPGESAEFASRQRDTQLKYTNDANMFNYTTDPNTQWRNEMAGLAGQLGGAMTTYLGTSLTKQSGASGGPTPYTDSLGGARGYMGEKGG